MTDWLIVIGFGLAVFGLDLALLVWIDRRRDNY